MLCFYCVFIIFTFYLLVHLSLLSFYCFYGFKLLFTFLALLSKHFVNCVFKKYFINKVYYCNYLSRLEWLQSVRDQLFFSGFSSEVKPLSSQRTGSEDNNLQDSAVKELLDLQQSPTCGLETLRSVDVGVSPRCFHQYFTKHSQYHRTDPGSVLPSRICGYQVNFRFSFFSPTKLVHFLTR